MKTEIKKLDSLSHNDTAATKLINDNFAALQKGVEDSLSRTGKTPNFMDAEFDMNSKRIINVSNPVDDTDAVNYGTYKQHIDQAIDAAQKAAVSANSSQNSAVAARQYARQAQASRDEAVEAAEEAKETVETGKTDLDNIINEGMVEISDAIDAGKEDLNQIIEDGSQLLTEGKEELGAIIDDGKEELNKIIEEGGSSNSVVQIVKLYENNWESQEWADPSYSDGFDYFYLFTNVMDESFSNVIVSFKSTDALSGNFSPVAEYYPSPRTDGRFNNSVLIYAKEIPSGMHKVSVTYIK